MKQITIQTKLDAGDSCMILRDGKLVNATVNEVKITKTAKETTVAYDVFLKNVGRLSYGTYSGPYIDESDAKKEIGFAAE